MPPAPPPRTLYTVGHSNHRPEALLELLRAHRVTLVADVRSQPRSRWPWFAREAMQAWLGEAGLRYVWLGARLGGRPRADALRGADGAPDYAAMAATPAFAVGLDELLALLDGAETVAVLCSEGDPRHCHREHLLARALRPRGVSVRHILRDGTLAEGGAPEAQLGLGL